MSKMSRRGLLGFGAALAASASLPKRVRAASCGPAVDLPARRSRFLLGRGFAAATTGLSDSERYRASADEILAGNVPAFLRVLAPVQLSRRDGGEGPQSATIFVTSDYLAVGSRHDFLRVPLDLPQAGRVATHLGMALPTSLMVDAIYAAAPTVVAPSPMPPTHQMRSMPYVLEHHTRVERARAGQPVMPLMAGHKKDLVLTRRLHDQPDRVAIYGWHRPSGRPIQPLSLVHGKGYADYSHGVRLVSRTVVVDDQALDLFDALEDPDIAPLLTREGRLMDAESLLVVG